MLANVLSLPVQHRLASDALLDVRIVEKRLRDDLSAIEKKVEKPMLPG